MGIAAVPLGAFMGVDVTLRGMMNTIHHASTVPWQSPFGAALAVWLATMGLGLSVISDAAGAPVEEVCEAQPWDRPVEAGFTRRGRWFTSVLDRPQRRVMR